MMDYNTIAVCAAERSRRGLSKHLNGIRTCAVVGNVIFPLFVGSVLYVVARPDSYISLILCELLGLRIKAGILSATDDSFWWRVVRNHAADFLWAYSFTFSVMFVGEKTAFNEVQLMGICCGIAVLMEVSQLINPYFTFDFIDILVECTGILTARLVYHGIIVKKRGDFTHESKQ